MFQRSCLVFAFLALMGLLAFSEPASAQKGGGGKGGGGGGPKMGGGGGGPKGGGGGGPRPGYPGGGYYRGSTYNRGGYYGGGFYGGLYFGGPSYYYLGGPIYYSSPYNYPYSYIYPTQRYSFYPDSVPSYSYLPPAPTVIDNRASIRVLVPVDDAKVLFDGSPTKQTGTDRYFHTPELDPSGGPYSYRIRAQWKQGDQEVIQERVVEVTPGKTAVADFR